jgi:hypothetical protein
MEEGGTMRLAALLIDEAESALAETSTAARRCLTGTGSEHFVSVKTQVALIAQIEAMEISLKEAREKLRHGDFLQALAKARLIKNASEELSSRIRRAKVATTPESKIAVPRPV